MYTRYNRPPTPFVNQRRFSYPTTTDDTTDDASSSSPSLVSTSPLLRRHTVHVPSVDHVPDFSEPKQTAAVILVHPVSIKSILISQVLLDGDECRWKSSKIAWSEPPSRRTTRM